MVFLTFTGNLDSLCMHDFQVRYFLMNRRLATEEAQGGKTLFVTSVHVFLGVTGISVKSYLHSATQKNNPSLFRLSWYAAFSSQKYFLIRIKDCI